MFKAVAAGFAFICLVAGPSRAQTPPLMDVSAFVTIAALQASNPGSGASGAGTILVIGDSITNQIFHGYSACGYSPLFFGINGLEMHDLAPQSVVDAIINATRPMVVVIALGKNDMADGRAGAGYPNWQQDAWYLPYYVQTRTGVLLGRTVKPVLMTVLPSERVAPAPWNNTTKLAQYNGYLVSNPPAAGNNVATVQGLSFVDFANPPAGVTPIVTDGPFLTPGFTWSGDGLYIHPIGASTALLWQYYAAAIKAGLAQIGLPCNNVQPPLIP